MKILYVLHAPFETPGFIESWAAERGDEQFYVSPYAGEAIPRHPFDLIVIMGGPQSAGNFDKFPYLKDEIALIQSAMKAKIPLLGFCLGAQLLGEALGAPSEPSPFKEVGIFPITLTEEGMRDPLLANLPKEFFVPHWHNDMPGLTKEAVVLAKSEGCPRQIIRYSSHAYGFQCHPEMTGEVVWELVRNCSQDLAAQGKYVQLSQDILKHDFFEEENEVMRCILGNFLAMFMKDKVGARVD